MRFQLYPQPFSSQIWQIRIHPFPCPSWNWFNTQRRWLCWGLSVSTVTGCSSTREHLNTEGLLHHRQTHNHKFLGRLLWDIRHLRLLRVSLTSASLQLQYFYIPVRSHLAVHSTSFQLFQCVFYVPTFPRSALPQPVHLAHMDLLCKCSMKHTAPNVLIKSYWQRFDAALVCAWNHITPAPWEKRQPKKKIKRAVVIVLLICCVHCCCFLIDG